MAPSDGRIRYNLALAYYKSADLPRAAEELEALHAQQPERRARDPAPRRLPAAARRARPPSRSCCGLSPPRGPTTAPSRTSSGWRSCGAGRWRRASGSSRHWCATATRRRRSTCSARPPSWPATTRRPSSASRARSRRTRGCPRCARTTAGRCSSRATRTGPSGPFARPSPESPNDYEANYFLGSVLATRGRPKDARPFAEKAAALRPQSDAGEGARRLARLRRRSAAAPAGPVSPLVGQPAPDVALHSAPTAARSASPRSAGARSCW